MGSGRRPSDPSVTADRDAAPSVDGRLVIGLNTSPQGVDWQTLDSVWARVGELDVFSMVWMNDHLTDPYRSTGGASLETVTAMAALAHRVPGRWLGHGVLAATFRHPTLVAKAATVLDHVTGGRYILGLGAGWHPGEHEPLGIPRPPMPERFDRFESSVEVIRALFSAEAAELPGVTREDPWYPLHGATNMPPPLTQGGPPIWLGGQRRRGAVLAARVASGWLLPAVVPGSTIDVGYFRSRRAAILESIAAGPTGPRPFAFAAKVDVGADRRRRREALRECLAFVDAGATHILLSMTPSLGPGVVDAVADDVARPLREALG